MQANCAGDLAKDNYSREWAVDKELAMSEDCLYLNVGAPADGRTCLPVYVWYFGGGLRVAIPRRGSLTASASPGATWCTR